MRVYLSVWVISMIFSMIDGVNNFFQKIYIFVPVRVIHYAGNRPENTVLHSG